jgi:hypothetical protein
MRTTLLALGLIAAAIGHDPASAASVRPESFRLRDMTLDLAIDFDSRRLSGSATCVLENWTDRPAQHVSLLLGRLLEASRVRDAAGRYVRFEQDVLRFQDDPMRQVTRLAVTLPRAVAPGARTTLRVDYAGYVVGYTELGWLYVRDRIDTTFSILRAEAMAFPVVGGLSDSLNRTVPDEDFTYDVALRVPRRMKVATGGTATITRNRDGTATWRYRSGRPSPFLNVAIAPFDTLAEGGVRVFYFPADSAGAARLLGRARAALQTLTDWFGPLHGPLHVTLTEIPDGWGSQASLVGGIIQTAAAFREPRRASELYHELTHLWNAPDLENPPPRWNEGLATFLENLLSERLDGWTGRAARDSARIARTRQEVAADSTLRTVPFAEYGRRGMTDNSYTVGALMFGTLYELVGTDGFGKIVGGYFQKFPDGGTTRDFATFGARATATDLTTFFDDWLFTTRWTERVAQAGSVKELAAGYASTGR